MAGTWQQTKTPGIYVQEDRNGKPRYKAAFRDARGVVTSKTFPRIGEAQTFLAEKRMQRRTNTLPDVSKGARTMADLWEESPRPTGASPPQKGPSPARVHLSTLVERPGHDL